MGSSLVSSRRPLTTRASSSASSRRPLTTRASPSASSRRLLTMAASSVSSQVSQKYDIFLNFHGDDVRFKFLSYLIFALDEAHLDFFVDNKLERGMHIETALMLAIQDSKVALAIFSKGYASSSWCLDELVKIMECSQNPNLRQKVIPIFYHVTPSDVKNVETGVFAQDFAKHKNDYRSHSKVPRWKAAMKAAGSLSGRIVHETSSEVDVLFHIVDDLLRHLRRNYPMLHPGEKKLFHASIHYKVHVFLHNLNVSPGKLCPNIHQQQRNGSMWTISRQQGRSVQADLNEFLTSTRVQVDYRNGYNSYYMNSGNPNWSYYVDGGNGNLYPYKWVVVDQSKQSQGQGRSDQAGREQQRRSSDQHLRRSNQVIVGSSTSNHSRLCRRPFLG